MEQNLIDYLIELKDSTIKNESKGLKSVSNRIIVLGVIMILVVGIFAVVLSVGAPEVRDRIIIYSLTAGTVLFVIFGLLFLLVKPGIKRSEKRKIIRYINNNFHDIVWIYTAWLNQVDQFGGSAESIGSLILVTGSQETLVLNFEFLPESAIPKLKKFIPNADYGYSLEKEDKYMFSE